MNYLTIPQFMEKEGHAYLKRVKHPEVLLEPEYYLAAARAGAKFPDRDNAWGTVTPGIMILCGAYLRYYDNDVKALSVVTQYATDPKTDMKDVVAESWDAKDSTEVQLQFASMSNGPKKPPIMGSSRMICVHKNVSETLLSFAFPEVPKSIVTFSLLPRHKWYNPDNELLSKYAHCFRDTWPDYEAAFEDMELSKQEIYDLKQTDEWLEVSNKISRVPLISALRMDVKDMEDGDRQSRKRMMELFTSKEGMVNMISNLDAPTIKQKDMAVEGGVHTQLAAVLETEDPTEEVEASELVHKFD